MWLMALSSVILVLWCGCMVLWRNPLGLLLKVVQTDAHLYVATHGSEIAILEIPTLRSHMFALLQLMQVHISIASSTICIPCHHIVANWKSCVIVWKGCVLSGICIKVYSSNASSKCTAKQPLIWTRIGAKVLQSDPGTCPLDGGRETVCNELRLNVTTIVRQLLNDQSLSIHLWQYIMMETC